jgi:hypothetical protein
MAFCAKQFKRLANGGCLIVIDAQGSPSLSYADCQHLAVIDQQALEILFALAIHLYLLRRRPNCSRHQSDPRPNWWS